MLTTDLARVTEWVSRNCESNAAAATAAIGWMRDDEITCGVYFEDFTGASITVTLAVAPGAVVPRTFLWAIFDYPFNQLGCDKIIAYVAGNNFRSRNLISKAGYVEEASIANYYPAGEPMVIYSMTKAMCNFLENDDGK